MTNPPEPTQQKWVDASMEQGFTLPKAVLRKRAWLGVIVTIILFFIFFYPSLFMPEEYSSLMPEEDKSDSFIFAGCWLLLFFAVFRYASRDKLVYLSSAGIRGRSAFWWGWQRITWAEPLTNS